MKAFRCGLPVHLLSLRWLFFIGIHVLLIYREALSAYSHHNGILFYALYFLCHFPVLDIRFPSQTVTNRKLCRRNGETEIIRFNPVKYKYFFISARTKLVRGTVQNFVGIWAGPIDRWVETFFWEKKGVDMIFEEGGEEILFLETKRGVKTFSIHDLISLKNKILFFKKKHFWDQRVICVE